MTARNKVNSSRTGRLYRGPNNCLVCLRSLSFPEQRKRHDAIHRATRGVFEWIWDNDSFRSWMEVKRGMFWVSGKPGSGKSTLIKLLAWHPGLLAHLRQAVKCRRAVIVGHFFDHKAQSLAHSIEGLLHNIIWQLLQKESHLFTHILGRFSMLQNRQEAVGWTRQGLQQVFEAMVGGDRFTEGAGLAGELQFCIFLWMNLMDNTTRL
jgi:hypothetical protein